MHDMHEFKEEDREEENSFNNKWAEAVDELKIKIAELKNYPKDELPDIIDELNNIPELENLIDIIKEIEYEQSEFLKTIKYLKEKHASNECLENDDIPVNKLDVEKLEEYDETCAYYTAILNEYNEKVREFEDEIDILKSDIEESIEEISNAKKYLMITNYKELWMDIDAKTSGIQEYHTKFISQDVIKDLSNRECIFVKVDKENKNEIISIFTGEVKNITEIDDVFTFEYTNLLEQDVNDYDIGIHADWWRYYSEE